eukprot:12062164-Alexandrium_andersonii.AAC.1
MAISEAWRRLGPADKGPYSRGRARVELCCGSVKDFEQYRRLCWVARFKCSLPKRPCLPIHRNMLPGAKVNWATSAEMGSPFP